MSIHRIMRLAFDCVAASLSLLCFYISTILVADTVRLSPTWADAPTFARFALYRAMQEHGLTPQWWYEYGPGLVWLALFLFSLYTIMRILETWDLTKQKS